MNKELYNARKEKGLCVDCGKEKENNNRVTCNSCGEKRRVYAKLTRRFLKEIGICPSCGKNKIFKNEYMCPECLSAKSERDRRYAENNKEKIRIYKKSRKNKLKEEGICIQCGKRKSVVGKTMCDMCLAKRRIRKREYDSHGNGYIPRFERPNYGLCYVCGGEINGSGRICEVCAERVTKNLNSRKEVTL